MKILFIVGFGIACAGFTFLLMWWGRGKRRGVEYRSAMFDGKIGTILADPRFDPSEILPEMLDAYISLNMRHHHGLVKLMDNEAIGPHISFHDEVEKANFEYRRNDIRVRAFWQ